MTHVHTWKPVPLEFRRYQCSCGATGFKRSIGGEIREHKVPRDYDKNDTIPTGSRRKGKRGPGGW